MARVREFVFTCIILAKKNNSLISKIIDLLTNHFLKYKLQVLSFESIERYSEKNPEKVINYQKFPLQLLYSQPVFNNPKKINNFNYEINGYHSYSAILKDVEVIGSSNLVLLNSEQALYDLKTKDINDKMYYSDFGIKYYFKNEVLIKTNKSERNIKKGILLTGNFSWNYFHLLYEIIVKFENYNKIKEELDIPILLDSDCFKVNQYMELLSMFNENKRELIPLQKGLRYKVNQLYYQSCPNLIPPNFKNPNEISAEDVLLNQDSLRYLRSKLLNYIINVSYPKRIFLSRKNASSRRSFNEDEVYRALQQYDFKIVFPECLSIPEQVTLFNNADVIIGGGGAAFSNLLFCHENCKIVLFVKHEFLFSAWTTIANYVGADLLTLAQTIDNSGGIKDIHEPYIIDTEILEQILSEWLIN